MSPVPLNAVEQMAYVGRSACGCVELVVADDPRRRGDVAKLTAGVIQRGGTVDRTTVREAHLAGLGCSHLVDLETQAEAISTPGHAWLSGGEADRHMRVAKGTAARLATAGEIEGEKNEHGHWRIWRESCDRWMRRGSQRRGSAA